MKNIHLPQYIIIIIFKKQVFPTELFPEIQVTTVQL